MTAMPAGRIGLKDRGRLAEGMAADIAIFDPATVSDNDDWAHPHQYATGFKYVIVNGEMVIDRETRTTAFPGKVLKKGLIACTHRAPSLSLSLIPVSAGCQW